jgi:16S rRNA (adenine1518-N6/adenine1519-N6)-dimethyltransferase
MRKNNSIRESAACSCPHDHDDHREVERIPLKKKFGQHFLRDQAVVDEMMQSVHLTPQASVCEIGCGDGFLTGSILAQPPARLWSFEIDPHWADYVRERFPHEALTIFEADILQVDWEMLAPHAPWILLANLPYQLTFPILYKLHQHRALFSEGAVMVQEEVAQKICAASGRDFGVHSLFFQHCFTWKLLCKIPPTAFVPPPKVYSRVIHFSPRADMPLIPDEEKFWKFVKLCFAQPRRTLQNNLQATHYVSSLAIAAPWAHLRAQQMKFQDFLNLWIALRTAQAN